MEGKGHEEQVAIHKGEIILIFNERCFYYGGNMIILQATTRSFSYNKTIWKEKIRQGKTYNCYLLY